MKGSLLCHLVVSWWSEDEGQLGDPVWQPAQNVDCDDGQNEPGHFGVRFLLPFRRFRVLRTDGFQLDDDLIIFKKTSSMTVA
jgi:hypothetical protein